MAQLKNLVDRGSFIREVDDFPVGVVDDGVQGFTIEGKKFVRAKRGSRFKSEELGVFANGSDMTARLQAKFNHAKVKMIELDADGGGDIVINGAVDCQGKTLIIRSGTKITGTGSITNGILKADYYDHVFDVAFNMEGMLGVNGWCVSPWWFGALGNSNGAAGNGNDDYPAIQKAINWVANQTKVTRNVALLKSKNAGAYRITQGLLIYRQYGNSYQQVDVNVVGEWGTGYFGNKSYGVEIFKDFKDGFGIAIQNGRSCRTGGFALTGRFEPPAATYTGGTLKNFLETKYENFMDAAVPFRQYSPDCGICIDPFTNNGTTPADGGYPGYSSFYSYATAGNSGNGSSGVLFKDIRIGRNMVSVMVSPNGSTRNAENITLEKISVARCRTGFACGQDQTKGNIIRNGVCWEDCHTLFDNCTYGERVGVMFNVDTFNIAGSVKRVFNLQIDSYFGTNFNNIYAESLIDLGYISGLDKVSITNGKFNFLNVLGGLPSADQVMYMNGVSFYNCTFRKYGSNSRLWFTATNTTFTDCYFERAPYLNKGLTNGNSVQFINCNLSAGKLGAVPDQGQFANASTAPNIPDNVPLGSFQIYNTTNATKYRYNVNDYERILIGQNTVSITVNTATWEATFSPSNTDLFRVGSLVVHTGNINSYEAVGKPTAVKAIAYAVLGEVKSVVGGLVTLHRVPYNIASGTYNPWIAAPLPIGRGFIGDMSNGSAVISNVELVTGTTWPMAGDLIKFPSNGSSAAYIKTVDSTAKTITMDRNAFFTAVGYSFINHDPEISFEIADADNTNFSSFLTSDSILKIEGMKIYERMRSAYNSNGLQYSHAYEILTSGYFAPNGTTKIHQAYYKQKDSVATISLTNGTHTLRGWEELVIINATAGNVVINLPTIAARVAGKRLTFLRTDATANTVTVQRAGTNTIQGATGFNVVDTKVINNNSIDTWYYEVNIDTNSAQTFTNKTLGAGTKINLGTVAAGDMYYGDSSGNLVRVGRGPIGHVWAVLSETVLGWKNDASGGGAASGSSIESIRTVTSNTTFTESDGTILVDTSAGNVNITINLLPAGKPASIKKITPDANIVTITPSSGTIDGDPTRTLDAYNEVIFMKSNGTNLFIFNN